jgi:hypothetical protein
LPDGAYVVFVVGDDNPGVIVAQSGFYVNDRFRDVTFPITDSRSEGAFRKVVMPAGVVPIPFDVVRDGSVPRRFNIVIPSLLKSKFSGGPNTALALGQVLADRGIPVTFVSSNTEAEADEQAIRDHLTLLTGIAAPREPVRFVAGNDPAHPVRIGHTDILLGTAWWTVQQFKHCLPELKTPRFVYLIQEFEPALYPYSTQYALADETYAMDHLPIFNHRFLYDFFEEKRIGCFANAEPQAKGWFGRLRAPPGRNVTGTWFDPVIDSTHFFYDKSRHAGAQRTLLFYARPNIAVRNLYEIAFAALARLAGEGAFEGWRLHSMGERAGDIYLPGNQVVEELPWMSFDDYAVRMRSCDVLLSLMLSPHPSYPPLEGAASGAIVVTNTFENKTAGRFSRVSGNILAVAPTIDGVTEGIREAMQRVPDEAARRARSRMSMPRDWTTALSGAADRIISFWKGT